MAAGPGVTVIPESGVLSTVQAAEVLNDSWLFLFKLLKDGRIPHRKVQTGNDSYRFKASSDTAKTKRKDTAALTTS
jgi:hypothetical protein